MDMTARPEVTLWPNGDRKSDFHWTGASITDNQLRALSLGAYVGRTCSHAVDTLWRECTRHQGEGTTAQQAAADLRKSWSVEDAVELRRTVGRLLDGMHSPLYEVAFPLAEPLGIAKRDGKAMDSPLTLEEHRRFIAVRAQLVGEDPRRAIEAHEAIYRLIAMKLLGRLGAVSLPPHVRAWDLARVPVVARMGFTAGLIDESEAWQLMGAALRSAQAEYPDWETFADGLLTGRAFWLAMSDVTEVEAEDTRVAAELHYLLEADTSPWRRVSLQP